MVEVAPLRSHDRAAWESLARAYHSFYQEQFPAETYDCVWSRLRQATELHALGAYDDGRLVGIAHYLFHGHVWEHDVCYLQDLFVDERARRKGAGRLLIASVEREARARGAVRLYWLTKHDNNRARRLYDRIATHSGFIRYECQFS